MYLMPGFNKSGHVIFSRVISVVQWFANDINFNTLDKENNPYI